MRIASSIILIFFFLIAFPKLSGGFSILSHEAVINAAWDNALLPTLRKRFPDQSDSDYVKAKAYAYGGAIMPDMGFFPFGSMFFTNLVHYVRSGDFTEALLNEAQNMNEYAFALGALAHYNADNYGHSLGVNLAVPMTYPKDQKKFGDTISYAMIPVDHRRVEFAFDVSQIARGKYGKEDYINFIGFEVPKPLLERAFLKTYGIEIGSVFGNLDLAFVSFRFFVQNLFPPLTKAAWANKKEDIEKLNPGITDQAFLYTSDRRAYEKKWGRTPIGVGFIALIIRFTPKIIGPARVLRFNILTPEAEQRFNECFDTVVKHYDESIMQEGNGTLTLRNLDYDTGRPSASCEYSLADKSYLKLLKKQRHDNYKNVTPEMMESIMQFYGVNAVPDSSQMDILYRSLDKKKIVCNDSHYQEKKLVKAN